MSFIDFENKKPEKKKNANIWSAIGATNHAIDREREENDFYATDPKALRILFDEGGYKFPSNNILEPCAGMGHLSEVLKSYGYNVTSYDLIDRGYCPIKNFFDIDKFDGSICTNPPYKLAQACVEHAMEIIPEGQEVVMYLKLTFLEGKARKQMYKKCPLKTLYVMSERCGCAKNGDPKYFGGGAVAYGFFVFHKYKKDEIVSDPIIKWIN